MPWSRHSRTSRRLVVNRWGRQLSDGAHGFCFPALHPSLSRSIQPYPVRSNHLSPDVNATSGRRHMFRRTCLVSRRGLVDEVVVEHGVVHDHREAVDECLLSDLGVALCRPGRGSCAARVRAATISLIDFVRIVLYSSYPLAAAA
jgi:hypothetical protein